MLSSAVKRPIQMRLTLLILPLQYGFPGSGLHDELLLDTLSALSNSIGTSVYT